MTASRNDGAAAKEAAAKRQEEQRLAEERRRRLEEEQQRKREAEQATRAMHKLVAHLGMASNAAREHFQGAQPISSLEQVNIKQPDAFLRNLAGDVFPGLTLDANARPTPPQAKTNKPGDTTLDNKPKPALSQQALLADARQLHCALNDKHNANQAEQILGTMTLSDKNELKQVYHQQFDPHGAANTLRNDFEKNLGKTDAYKLEDTLDKQDNVTNYGGDLRVLMHETTGGDNSGANANLVDYLSSLNSKQLAQASSQYKQFYGQTLDQALKQTYGGSLSKTTNEALPYLLKGADQRSAADNVALAKIGAATGGEDGKRLLGIALSDSSEAGNEARQQLQGNQQFLSQVSKQWSKGQDAQVVNDYIHQGHISLATIASGDGKNPQNLDHAIATATAQERAQYAAGQELALNCKTASSQSEKDDLAYYNKIHTAFNTVSKGNKAEVVQWEDKLVNGGNTLVSKLAAESKTPAKMAEAAQNLTQQDWQRLQDPINGQAYRQQIVSALNQFANPEQRRQVLTLLTEKASAPTWQQAQTITQPFLQSVANDGSAKNVLNSLAQLNAGDADRYHGDAQFRKQIDDVVDSKLTGANRAVARQILQGVQSNGERPHLSATDNVLLDSLNGASSTKTLTDLQAAVKERPQVKQLAGACKVGENPVDALLVDAAYRTLGNDAQQFLKTGTLTLDQQLRHGFPKTQVYENLATASSQEQATVLKELTPQERQVAQNAIDQGGKLTLADQLRSFVLNDGSHAGNFMPALAQLDQQQKESLFNEYNKKYGGDLAPDFLSRVSSVNRQNFEDLLTASGASGQHDFAAEIASHDGKVEDASNLTADRAADNFRNQLTEFNAAFKDMPPQAAQALNDALNQAQADYNQARTKYNADHPGFWDTVEHIGVQLAVTTVTIAAAAGASALLGPEAGAGVILASRLLASGLTYAIANGAATDAEGGNYNWSPENLLKQAAVGSLYGFSGAAASHLAESAIGKLGGDTALGLYERAMNAVSEESSSAMALAAKFGGKAGEKALQAGFSGTAVATVSAISAPITGRHVDLATLERSFIAGAGASLVMPYFNKAGSLAWEELKGRFSSANASLAQEAAASDTSPLKQIASNTTVKGSIFGQLPTQRASQDIWAQTHHASPADQSYLDARFKALNHIGLFQEIVQFARQYDNGNAGNALRDLFSWANDGHAQNPAEISQFITNFAATHPQLSVHDIKDAVLSGSHP